MLIKTKKIIIIYNFTWSRQKLTLLLTWKYNLIIFYLSLRLIDFNDLHKPSLLVKQTCVGNVWDINHCYYTLKLLSISKFNNSLFHSDHTYLKHLNSISYEHNILCFVCFKVK